MRFPQRGSKRGNTITIDFLFQINNSKLMQRRNQFGH
jgi:hypothetical protein